MRPDLTRINHPLGDLEPALRKLPVLRTRIPFKRPLPRNRLVVHRQTEHPVWLDAASCMAPDGERVEAEVPTAGWPDGLVADGHRPRVCDAVERVPEVARAQVADLTPASWGVVVEGCGCAEGFDQVEIMRRTGGYRGIAGAAVVVGLVTFEYLIVCRTPRVWR